jgi:hypothetical protein
MKIFKNLLLQNQQAVSIKLGTNYPWVKRIQIKGQVPFKGGNHRNVRKGWGHLKVLFLRTMKLEKLNFT